MNNVCRLCGITRNLIHVFHELHGKNLKAIRYVIWVTTGVEIKETDKASKMVCQRCCEIAVKLHKYRTNAIINDKLQKEQCGDTYTAPVINQEEILRLSTEIIKEHMEIIRQNSNTSGCLNSGSIPYHLLNSLPRHPSLRSNRVVRDEKYRHPSVRKLYKNHTDVIVPVDVFKSDVSPVISMDSEEVSEWYAKEASNIQERLTDIVIKKVPCNTSVDDNSQLSTADTELAVNEMNSDNLNINTNSSNDTQDKNILDSSYNKEDNISTPIKINTIQQSPFTLSRTVHQRARKKTTRKLHSSRKRSIDDDEDEVIPEKKVRSFGNRELKYVSNKVDLPNQLPSDKTQQKTIFTSSLELTPVVSSPLNQIYTAPSSALSSESTSSVTILSSLLAPNSNSAAPLFEHADCQNIMSTEKTLSIFICSMCNQLCDTKKELQDHERVHLTCKFCKIRVKNLKLLQQHQNESCFINIVKNPPNLELTRVDSITSMVEKYPEAFETLHSQQEEDGLLSLEDIGDISAVDACASTSSQFVEHVSNSQKAKLSIVEAFSLSDKRIGISGKETPTTSPNKTSTSSKLNNSSKLQNYANEKEMIHLLFKKYNGPSMKYSVSSETKAIPKNAVVCTSTNLIILEGVLSELDQYNIPVEFLFKPKVSAKFQEQSLGSREMALESWKDRKVIGVQKQAIYSYGRNTSSSSSSVLTVNGSKLTISVPTNSGSLILNKPQTNGNPSLPSNSTHSKNTIVSESATANSSHSLGQLSLVALPTTPTAIIAQTSNTPNLNTASLILNSAPTTSSTIPCPALYVPQSGKLIQNSDQNEQIIPTSSNVTNLSQYVVLTTPDVAQQLSGINLEYLTPLSTQKQAGQQLTVVTPATISTTVAQPVKPQTSTIRVKNLWELTK